MGVVAGAGARPVSLAWGMSSAVPRDLDWLTRAEREVHTVLVVPKRASDWRVGRWLGKAVVRSALGAPELPRRDVQILAAHTGAPTVAILAPGAWPEVALSLSHAWGMGFAVAGGAPARLGCDVEALRPRSEAFVSDYFTAAEAAAVRGAPAGDQVAWANLVWSAKESALKALGEGLRLDTRSMEVTVGDDPTFDGWRGFRVTTPGAGTLRGHWRVTPGFVWTLVADVSVQW